MSLPIWNHLCQHPSTLVATFTEKHAKRVHDSTTQLHQSLDSILSTLNRRAIAFTHLANFESALHDAKLMQQLSPSSALGYIREAIIYSDQGKQRDVIDVCSKALNMVDTKDPAYGTLQQTKADAEQCASTHIDFVSLLPAELVMTTLVPMFMDESISSLKPCPYLNVSTVWRDRIIQSPCRLRFMIEDEEEDHRLQVFRFAQYTKTLHISSCSQGTWLSDLLVDKDFCSLQEMCIRGFHSDEITQFVPALESISNTLTNLTLYPKAGRELSLPITHIVSTCPNLESLKVRDHQDADLSSLPMTTWPKMKYLSITNAGKNIGLEHLVTVSKRFPSLKELTLSPFTNLQPALVVSDYSPRMQKLDCFIFEGVEMTFSEDPCEKEEQQTITNLCISCVPCIWYETHNLSCILQKYQGTLVELSMTMESDYNKPEDLWSIQYPCLKKLSLHSWGWWIPRNAPLLEELAIRINSTNPADKVLDTIPPNLKELDIMLYGLATDDHPAVARYFIGLAEQAQLTHLHVSFGSRAHNYESIIDALCHLHQLEHLKIRFDIDWEPMDLEGYLVKIAKRCTKLTYLEIQSSNAPSINTLHAINQLEHLEQLSFSTRGAGKQEGFWEAVESFKKPMWIKMFPKNPVHDLEIKALAQHRPDMRITVSEY